jgi:DNA repair exonuclease SbcCD ATPase subunit
VRLGPSTPDDYVHARVLVPRNPGVTLGQAIGERDRSRSQAAEDVSRAEALWGQLADATEQLAEALRSAQSAQAEASRQRARAEGMPCPLCDLVFVSILHLASEKSCPAICKVRDGS